MIFMNLSVDYNAYTSITSFQAVVAALFMNIYIVGLNQLSDIEIDKVAWYENTVGTSSCI